MCGMGGNDLNLCDECLEKFQQAKDNKDVVLCDDCKKVCFCCNIRSDKDLTPHHICEGCQGEMGNVGTDETLEQREGGYLDFPGRIDY